MDKFLSRSLAVATFLAGAGVFYHFVIYLPGIESGKKAAEAEAIAKQEQEQQQRTIQYQSCMSTARQNYESDWATACKSDAADNTAAFKNCLATPSIVNNQFMGPQWCQKQYGRIDASSSCALPSARADVVNQYLKDSQSQCEGEAKLGL